MKKTISLCLACLLLVTACVFSASCAQAGLTLPSMTTPLVGQTSGTSLSQTTGITTSVKPTAGTTRATTSVPKPPPDLSKIAKITYLDFRPEMNKWAERNADGNLVYTQFAGSDYINSESGMSYYPFALYHENNGYNKNLDISFGNNGETLKLTATDAENPGIVFGFSRFDTYAIGAEENTRAEYIKIRFKNKSSATKLTFMGTNNSYGAGRLDMRVSATIEIEPNSDEWQTITLSMVEGTKNSANNRFKANTWNSFLKEFGIFPFGYGVDCEAKVGSEMEIDYVVIGCRSYTDTYQSALESPSSVTPEIPPVAANISNISYLDFSVNNNKWSERDADGNLLHTKFKASQCVIGSDGKAHYPFALYLENNGFNRHLDTSFAQNGETLKVTANHKINPGIVFRFADNNKYPIGKEADGRAEYVKIRLKNTSSATKLTFMGSNNSYNDGEVSSSVSATIDIKPNSNEWQIVTISMVDGTAKSANNTGTGSAGMNTWASYLKEFAIFPFGYGKDCEAKVGSEMEIDYVVIGSSEFVASYQSELEKSAS